MANVIPIFEDHEKQPDAGDGPVHDERPSKGRRVAAAAAHGSAAAGGLAVRLFARVALGMAAVLFAAVGRLAFFFSTLLAITLVVVGLIALTGADVAADVFLPMAKVTGFVVGIYIVAEMLVEGIRLLQQRT